MAVLLAALGSRQHGIVERAQLRAAGCPSSTLGDWIRAGHLHRLYPRVYSVVPLPLLTSEGRWLAAVRACPAGTVLSHQPAGQLAWIVSGDERVALHVSLPPGKRCRLPGIVAHRPRRLASVDVTKRRGIPVTTRTRTVWDLAYVLSPTGTRRAFEQAEKRRDLDRSRLAELLDSAPSRRGSAMIRELLSFGAVPLDRTRTRLEEVVLEVCSDGMIALPAVNVPLLGYEVDFLWERERFVVEADGGEHLSERQRIKDNVRDVRLARAGYLVRRFTWWEVQDERAVAREILSILRERSAMG